MNLVEVRTLAGLPSDLRRLLPPATASPDGIADRGGRFNPTDVVDHKLPMSRFTLAAIGQTCSVIAVEHGGFVHNFEVVEYRQEGGTWTVTGRETRQKVPESLSALLSQR